MIFQFCCFTAEVRWSRSRDRCVSVIHKAVVSGAVRVSLIGLKISGDEEDEGKRDGVEKDRRKKSSGSDIG